MTGGGSDPATDPGDPSSMGFNYEKWWFYGIKNQEKYRKMVISRWDIPSGYD
jgi:hypothetical protein